MLKNIKKEKAITLIALVVTIVVILILAGISIATLTGENGIINKANVAKEESKKAEYKEELELIGLGLQVEDGINNLSTKDFMDKYENEIRQNKKFNKSEVEVKRKSDETIIVKTKEGYVYKITKTKVDLIGKQGETTPPDLKDSDIEGVCNPSDWTNGEVKVTVKVNNKELSKYTIKYSLDGKTNWRTYTGPIAFKDNGSLFVRVENELLEFGGVTVVNVANIDRLAPKQFVPTATSTTNSITLTGSTTDTPKTEKDGCSGIKEYYFSKDNGATWEQNSNKLETSYTFNKLTQGKEYTLKMKAVDKAGNEIITNAITKTTGKVEGLTESNAITYGKTGNKMFAYLNNVTREGKIVSGQTGKYTNICDKFDGWVIDDTKPNGVFYLGREHKSVPDTSKPTEINTEPIYFFKGIIKSVRVYNRALEDWERNDNYDTDCQRYNIK